MATSTEWLEKDYYETLGVAATASDAEIRKAYRKLARAAHPDANPDDPGAENRFKEISAAYDVLGDPEKRKEYDDLRQLGRWRSGGLGDTGGDFRVHVNSVDDLGDLSGFGGLGDIFGDMFATSRRTGHGQTSPPRGPRPRVGQDLAATARLAFVDAVYGTDTSIQLVSEAVCDTCHGSCAAAGATRVACNACGGVGQQVTERGGFAMRQTCPVCRGSGERIDRPCETCAGRGRVQRSRNIKVRIPPGVEDGQTIRLPGRGAPGYDGGPPGDLYVTVDVDPHPEFGRVGNHLTLTVPVTYAEAVLGAEITVPTLDGGGVTVRVPPGTPAGRVLRVSGKGVPKRDATGDLLLTLDIQIPTRPSEQERELITKLADIGRERRPRARWEATR